MKEEIYTAQGLLTQFERFSTKQLEVRAYQIKKGDMVEYVTGNVAELVTKQGCIQFSHTKPIALGDYLVTVPDAFVATHMEKPIFQGCYVQIGKYTPSTVNESAATKLLEQAHTLSMMPGLNHSARKTATKVANTLKSVAFLLRNGEKPL